LTALYGNAVLGFLLDGLLFLPGLLTLRRLFCLLNLLRRLYRLG
jgi:hypothetical protein